MCRNDRGEIGNTLMKGITSVIIQPSIRSFMSFFMMSFRYFFFSCVSYFFYISAIYKGGVGNLGFFDISCAGIQLWVVLWISYDWNNWNNVLPYLFVYGFGLFLVSSLFGIDVSFVKYGPPKETINFDKSPYYDFRTTDLLYRQRKRKIVKILRVSNRSSRNYRCKSNYFNESLKIPIIYQKPSRTTGIHATIKLSQVIDASNGFSL